MVGLVAWWRVLDAQLEGREGIGLAAQLGHERAVLVMNLPCTRLRSRAALSRGGVCTGGRNADGGAAHLVAPQLLRLLHAGRHRRAGQPGARRRLQQLHRMLRRERQATERQQARAWRGRGDAAAPVVGLRRSRRVERACHVNVVRVHLPPCARVVWAVPRAGPRAAAGSPGPGAGRAPQARIGKHPRLLPPPARTLAPPRRAARPLGARVSTTKKKRFFFKFAQPSISVSLLYTLLVKQQQLPDTYCVTVLRFSAGVRFLGIL